MNALAAVMALALQKPMPARQARAGECEPAAAFASALGSARLA